MKDKNGKSIRNGTWLLCINDINCGETVQVTTECGTLCIPSCNSIECGLPLSGFADEDGKLIDYIVIDDPTKHTSYAQAAKKYAKLNLAEINKERYFCPEILTLEQMAKLRMLGYEDLYPEGEEGMDVSEIDVIAADCDNVDNEDYCEDTYHDDEELIDDHLSLFIKTAPHYLVFASNCRWNGASGYKICDSRKDAIYRPYDVTINPVYASPNGKTLVCREASHDVPMGSTTVIIALTENEYRWLENAEFKEIKEFVNEHSAKAYQK